MHNILECAIGLVSRRETIVFKQRASEVIKGVRVNLLVQVGKDHVYPNRRHLTDPNTRQLTLVKKEHKVR